MIKIAIAEDDDATRGTIEGYIARYAAENGKEFKVFSFSDGMQLTENYRSDYDIIFLDVRMPQLDGMKTARFIRKLDKEVVIVFITNMAQYAIKGYAVDALDFLLKPVSYFAFAQQMNRSLERVGNKKKIAILLPTENGVKKVSSADIYYIESFKHQMTVHTKSGAFSFYGTMKELEGKLAPADFARCNNCYLVNLAYVDEIRDGAVVVDGDELAVSRPRKKDFTKAFFAYVNKGTLMPS